MLLVLLSGIDLYLYYHARQTVSDKRARKILSRIFWCIALACYIIILAGWLTEVREWHRYLRVYLFGSIFILYFSKLVFIPFLAVHDLVRQTRRVARYFVTGKSSGKAGTELSRRTFFHYLGLTAGGLTLSSMTYGMIRWAYDYQIKRVTVRLPGLPASFEGFRIVQFSDLHLGSFVSTWPVEQVVYSINRIRPDIIVFTGDLVNDRADEADLFIPILKTLRAPMGVFSILGNHDYGDYVQWESAGAKAGNLAHIRQQHREAGWKLLLNENRIISRNGHKIAIAGVENWGFFPSYQQYGNLGKALTGTDNIPVKLLLSHDPSHWVHQAAHHPGKVDITFSGHTHGMQFGIELPGFKWSPVQYIHRCWAGLYAGNGRHLYVNRGIGFIGYPGRVGILPEITVFELRRS